MIFVFLLSIIAPTINDLALTGKGTLICDSQNKVYVIQGTDRISDLSLSETAIRFLGDASTSFTILKSEQDLIKERINRLRYLDETEEQGINIVLHRGYKAVGYADSGDCVECDGIDDSACYNPSEKTYSNMRPRDKSQFSLFGRLFHYGSICSRGITEPNERINMSFVQVKNESSPADYWQGFMYSLDIDFEVDELIHATSVTYTSLYSDDDTLVDDVFPVVCDADNQPSITLIGIPIFMTEFWIFGMILMMMVKFFYFYRSQR